MKDEVTDRLGTIDEAYQTRVDGLASANKGKNEEAEKAREDSRIVSVDTPFSESAESQAIAADPDDTGSATAGTEQGHAPNEVIDRPADNEAAEKLGDNKDIDKPTPDKVDDETVMYEPVPNKGWTKDDIVDYIVESDVDDQLERADLEKMTKAELLDRFTDYEG